MVTNYKPGALSIVKIQILADPGACLSACVAKTLGSTRKANFVQGSQYICCQEASIADISHVVVLMLENRSFDSTHPGRSDVRSG